MFNKATEYIDKVIEEKKLPLLDVLVFKDHELLYRHSGSYTGKHGEDDILSMYSCTKVVTAVSGMRLVEEGKMGNILSFSAKYLHSSAMDTKKNAGWKQNKDICGGGVLFDLGSHATDLIYYLCGEFESVIGKR